MEKLLWLVLYLFMNIGYLWLRRRPAKYYFRSRIDNKIPLFPLAIVPYISYFFLFILAVCILFFSPYFLEFIQTMVIAQVAASVIWYLFPNGMIRPEIVGQGRTRNWVRRLHQSCGDSGCAFPSAHTYHSLIIGVYLIWVLPQFQTLIAVWVASIVMSTVLTKQHFAADVAGGMLVTLMAVKL